VLSVFGRCARPAFCVDSWSSYAIARASPVPVPRLSWPSLVTAGAQLCTQRIERQRRPRLIAILISPRREWTARRLRFCGFLLIARTVSGW
jgi:hypothetical protein